MSIKLINSDSSVMLQTINRGRDDRTVGRDEKNRLNGAHVPATALCTLHIKAQRSAVMCSTFSTESICTSPYDRGQKVAVYGHSRLGEVSCGRSLLLHIITTETITAGLCFPVTVPVTSTSLSTTFCLDMLLFFFTNTRCYSECSFIVNTY